MIQTKLIKKGIVYGFSFILIFTISACENQMPTTTDKKEPTSQKVDPKKKSTEVIKPKQEVKKLDAKPIKTVIPPIRKTTKIYDPNFYSEDNLVLEKEYKEMLEPIASLKSTDSKIYWFIVSWLNTKYKTPNWNNYNNHEWRINTKKTGIDCSGFARVMEQEVFNKKVMGGSQFILDTYCTRVDPASLAMGDLVFFKAPGSESDRIIHVGVYLKDRLFVHATSTRSAAKGKGLNINSLDEKNWAAEYVTGARVNGETVQ